MSPKRAYGVGFSATGSGASTTPILPRSKRLVIRPRGSIIAEMPVFAARATGSPSSIARTRAIRRCCIGPAQGPNQDREAVVGISRRNLLHRQRHFVGLPVSAARDRHLDRDEHEQDDRSGFEFPAHVGRASIVAAKFRHRCEMDCSAGSSPA